MFLNILQKEKINIVNSKTNTKDVREKHDLNSRMYTGSEFSKL